MADDSAINPVLVEGVIDACRICSDWNGVFAGLKRYAHIFDIGAATSTYQHGSLGAVRAYYWAGLKSPTES